MPCMIVKKEKIAQNDLTQKHKASFLEKDIKKLTYQEL